MTTPTLIDLDYDDPPAPRDLAERARRRGLALRRRRRTGLAVLGCLLAIGGCVGALSLDGPLSRTGAVEPAGIEGLAPATSEALLRLPVNSGDGRALTDSPSVKCPLDVGAVHDLHTLLPNDKTWGDQLVWINRVGMLVSGYNGGPYKRLTAQGCLAMDRRPSEGLWLRGLTTIGGTGDSDPMTTLLWGVVRGPVTRVVLQLPSGPHDAHLAPLSSDPELGTLYWLTYDDFRFSGFPADSKAPRIFQEKGTLATSHTVYRGDRAVFHCTDIVPGHECPAW